MNDCTERLLGCGSFGDVYERVAYDPPAVIKYLNRLNQDGRSVYRKECNILKKLSHPNIVLLIGIEENETENKFGIVMEYCRRGTLEKLLNDSKIIYSMRTVIEWAVRLFDALKYMFFEHRVIHRDIKPENIFVTEYYMLKLGDFGLTRLATQTESASATFAGTPRYMSPPQIERTTGGTEHLEDAQKVSEIDMVLFD